MQELPRHVIENREYGARLPPSHTDPTSRTGNSYSVYSRMQADIVETSVIHAYPMRLDRAWPPAPRTGRASPKRQGAVIGRARRQRDRLHSAPFSPRRTNQRPVRFHENPPQCNVRSTARRSFVLPVGPKGRPARSSAGRREDRGDLPAVHDPDGRC